MDKFEDNSTEGPFDEELFRLRALVRSFELLNSSLDLEMVLDRTLSTAVSLLKAEMGSLALLNDERDHLEFVRSTDPEFEVLKRFTVPIDQGIAGYVARTGEIVRVEDTQKDDRFYQEIDNNLHHVTRSYLCVPLKIGEGIIGTAQLMNRLTGDSFTAEDERLFKTFAQQAAIAIHNAQMHEMQITKKALDTELRLSREIQSRLFPESLPLRSGFECYGDSIPSREIGGDYYSFIERSDGSLDVVLGDVSGKGIPAALLVSELHTGIHLLSRFDFPLDQTAIQLNQHLEKTILEGKFITCFMGRFHNGDGSFEYVNAGHPPPFIVSPDGSVRELERTAVVLGLPNNPIESRADGLKPGDMLVAFSDAYSESMNNEGELYGEERLMEIVSKVRMLSLPHIAEIIKEETEKFRGHQPPSDDATLVLIRKTLNPQ